MYFGDFLVKKKIITNDQLIIALSHQLESLPSLIRLIHEAKLVSGEKLLDVIKKQIQLDTDVVHILKSEKLIGDEKINELLMLQLSKKPPLGEVLVQLGFTDQNTINLSLDEYFNEKDLTEKSTDTPTSNTVEENLLNDAALESLKELGMDISELMGASLSSSELIKTYPTKNFIDQFFEVFSEKFKNKLMKLISITEAAVNDGSDVSNYTNSLYRDIHMLKGTLTLVELNKLNELISLWDQSIELVISRPSKEIESWVRNNSEVLRQVFELIWSKRQKIKDLSTDEFLSDDNDWQTKIKNLAPKN